MTAARANRLWRSIDVIEAQEHLALIRAIQYPKLTKNARIERDKKLYLQAYPRHIYKRESKDASFLQAKLGGSSGRRK